MGQSRNQEEHSLKVPDVSVAQEHRSSAFWARQKYQKKKKITEPRIGQLQFSSIRRKKINQQYVMFIFLGLITFLGGIGTFIIFSETPNGILKSFENFPLLP